MEVVNPFVQLRAKRIEKLLEVATNCDIKDGYGHKKWNDFAEQTLEGHTTTHQGIKSILLDHMKQDPFFEGTTKNTRNSYLEEVEEKWKRQ